MHEKARDFFMQFKSILRIDIFAYAALNFGYHWGHYGIRIFACAAARSYAQLHFSVKCIRRYGWVGLACHDVLQFVFNAGFTLAEYPEHL